MAVVSTNVRVRQAGSGVSLYIQKPDAEEMKLKLGDRFQMIFDDQNPSNVIITKSLNFNPQEILAKISGKEIMVSTAKEKKEMPRAYCVSPCLGEVIRETLPISDEVGMYGIQ